MVDPVVVPQAGVDPVTHPDLLAEMADPDLVELWTPLANVRAERELWLHVMTVQRDLGLDIPEWAILSSRGNLNPGPSVLDRIDARERVTRHDLKARLEVFCEQAGHEYHHLGMTSADVVDNMAQLRMLRSIEWLERSHQISLPCKARYLMRGIKGAVGTHQDQLDLLGSPEACVQLDATVAAELGFPGVMTATAQVYPRSQDLEVLSELTVAVAQTNPDRGLFALLSGFQAMAAAYAGSQWNEGDVSTSVVRRYCLRGAWFAASAGLCHATP